MKGIKTTTFDLLISIPIKGNDGGVSKGVCKRFRKIGWNEILRRQELGYYINIEQLKPAKSLNLRSGEEEVHGLSGRGRTFREILGFWSR